MRLVEIGWKEFIIVVILTGVLGFFFNEVPWVFMILMGFYGVFAKWYNKKSKKEKKGGTS